MLCTIILSKVNAGSLVLTGQSTFRVSDNMVQFAVTFPGLTVEYSRDIGQNWSVVASDASIQFGNNDVIHLRTKYV